MHIYVLLCGLMALSAGTESPLLNNTPLNIPEFSSCSGISQFLKSPEQYGIVIGDVVARVETAHSNQGKTVITYKIGEEDTFMIGQCADGKWDGNSDREGAVKLTFNPDGTAKGRTASGKDIFILIGEISTDGQVIKDLEKKKLNDLAMGLVEKNKLPGHDAPTWFYYQSENYIQISYVFPLGFIHPSYGPQPHIRIFCFSRPGGEWKVSEDNSSVKLK